MRRSAEAESRAYEEHRRALTGEAYSLLKTFNICWGDFMAYFSGGLINLF